MEIIVTKKTSVVDQPKKHDSKDQFGMDVYKKALIDFIENADTPITIALQGEWGSGKTSLMNTLEHELTQVDKALYHRVWINTWQYSLMRTPEEAVVTILSGIIDQIGQAIKNIEEQKLALYKHFGRWLPKAETAKEAAKFGTKFLLNVVGHLGNIEKLGTDAVAAYEKTKSEPSESDISALKTAIAGLVKEAKGKSGKRGFLFFIDDLDRIDPPVAVQILELMKNIFDLENCVFVLAIDYDVVIKGLKPKFGELTDKNEREFRSFFDKIIQLPFSMPVSSYNIDDFLIESLVDIGFVTSEEIKLKDFAADLSEFARLSVGRNPRSLKRLANILSLINLINNQGSKTQDESYEKLLNFALVCMQVSYPTIYNYLVAESDFKKWDETLAKRIHLDPLSEAEAKRLDDTKEFDEPWEKALYRLCQKDIFLRNHAFDISRILNKILLGIPADKKQDVGNVVAEIIQMSAVTNLRVGEPEALGKPENLHHTHWLHILNNKLLPTLQAITPLEFQPVSMPQKRIQNKLWYHFKGADGYAWFAINQNQYVLGWAKGDGLYWGDCPHGTFEEELTSRGIKKEDFVQLQDEFSRLKKDYNAFLHEGNIFPISKSKSEGKLQFEYGNTYLFPFASLEDAVSDKAVEGFAKFIVEFISIRAKMFDLLKGKDK